MRMAAVWSIVVCGGLACGPAIKVKAIGSRVDPLPAATATPTPGAEKALGVSLPGGWRLNGGPADFSSDAAAKTLGEEAGRFRGLKSYATAEYVNGAQHVISAEAFVMSSPESAAGALALGKPGDARAITGDDLDEGFAAGLRAEGRRGAMLVRVRWFEDKDEQLADAGVDVMRDLLAAGAAAGLTASPAAGSPAPSATPAALPTGSAAPSPTP